MASIIQVSNGKTQGQHLNESLALKLCWLTAWLFLPINFKGLWRITTLICRLLGVSDRQWVELTNGLTFTIDLKDPYWNRLISPRFRYEPELMLLLALMKNTDHCFIDCGANMGFWSCHAASAQYGNNKVIAVEPLEANHRLIVANAEKNQLAFRLYKNAVSDTSGDRVPLYKPGSHASVSLTSDKNNDTGDYEALVETITLDDLVTDSIDETENILLKLDVEGVEIKALQGAAQLLQHRPVIAYEDHADEADCEVSRFIMEQLGYRLLFIDESGQASFVDTIDRVKAIKSKPGFGYNFIACHPESAFAHKVIELLQANGAFASVD